MAEYNIELSIKIIVKDNGEVQDFKILNLAINKEDEPDKTHIDYFEGDK